MSQTFSERSAARFAKVSAVIKELFKNHPEEADEALAIAKSMLSAARGEAIAEFVSDAGVSPEFADVFAAPHGDEIIRPTLTREITAGNPWVHGAAFEKSFRRATSPATFDAAWHEPIGRVKKYSDAKLAKGEVVSRVYSFLEKLRPHSINDEAEQLAKAARASDVALFAQIGESVLARVAA